MMSLYDFWRGRVGGGYKGESSSLNYLGRNKDKAGRILIQRISSRVFANIISSFLKQA